MKYTTNTIIIGAGVAGMTAAIYLKRANINFILLESLMPGGQINRSSCIENYPGFKNIDGPTLSMNIFEQLQSLDVEIKFEKVMSISLDKNFKEIKTNDNIYRCKNIIIATGRKPKELGLENEKELTGHGVSWCALCDGHFYKDQVVAVVGGGNSAFEESLYLSNICKKVYLIHRNQKFKASSILQNKVKEKSNIEILVDSVVTKINSKNNILDSIIINQKDKIFVKGLFIYIGACTDISFLENIHIELQDNYIKVDNNMETNIKGIYACGDVIYKKLYQLSTAIGEAAAAANSIIMKSSTD